MQGNVPRHTGWTTCREVRASGVSSEFHTWGRVRGGRHVRRGRRTCVVGRSPVVRVCCAQYSAHSARYVEGHGWQCATCGGFGRGPHGLLVAPETIFASAQVSWHLRALELARAAGHA